MGRSAVSRGRRSSSDCDWNSAGRQSRRALVLTATDGADDGAIERADEDRAFRPLVVVKVAAVIGAVRLLHHGPVVR